MIFSFDSALGYLTASPKNLGTALDLHARLITHTNISDKTGELLLKNYRCSLSKLGKWNYTVDMAWTLVPNMSENDSVNLFLDCIERTLNVHEAAEDDNDEEKDHVQDSKVK